MLDQLIRLPTDMHRSDAEDVPVHITKYSPENYEKRLHAQSLAPTPSERLNIARQ